MNDYVHLIAKAESLGYSVEFKPYCEDAETPGFLGMYAGVCCHGRKTIKIRTEGRTAAQIRATLEHELEHAAGAQRGSSGDGVVCGGSHGALG